jgi:hypothetical protein
VNPESSPSFAGAFSLVIFGSGPDDGTARDAIQHLLGAGYPANKIKYYRGGASTWSALGLNISVGGCVSKVVEILRQRPPGGLICS